MRKRKKDFPLEKGNDIIFSLSGSVRRTNNTILLSGVLGTTPTSWDVALVSPFTK